MSENRYQALFNSVSEGLFQTDLDGTYVLVNPAFATIFGYELEELLSGKIKTRHTYAHDSDREALLRDVNERGEVKGRVLQFRRSDGSVGWEEISLSLRRDEKGSVIGYEGILRDITDSIQYREKLRALNVQAEALNKAETIDEAYKATFNAMHEVLGYESIDVIKVESGSLVDVLTLNESKPLRLPLDGPGITVRAARTGVTQLIPDIRNDDEYVRGRQGSLSELAVPVTVNGEVVVVLNTESTLIDAFNEQDRVLLETLALHLAFSMIKLREREELLRYESRLEALHRHATDLGLVSSIQEMADATMYVLENILGFFFAAFAILDDDSLKYLVVRGVTPRDLIILPLDGPGITVRAAKTGETQRITDIREDKDYVSGSGDDIGIISELAVPVTVGGMVAAIINVESQQPGFFSEQDQDLVETLALHVASALERLWNEEERHRYEERLSALHTSAIALSEARNLDEVVKASTEAMRRTLGLEVAGYIEVKGDTLKTLDLLGAKMRGITLSLNGKGVTSKAARTGQTIIIGDTREEPSFVEGSIPALSEMAVPVKADGKVVAVLNVESLELDAYDENDRLLMETLAQHVGSALSRIRNLEHLEDLVREKTQDLMTAERIATAGKIAAMVGHDIRSPLQTIMNAVHLLEKAPQMKDELLGMIKDSVDRSVIMLDDLRSRTRVQPLQILTVDLENLIRSSVSESSIPSPIDVDLAIDEGLQAVELDPMKMRRVFDNMIRNAVEAMPKGGTLTIHAEKTPDTVSISIGDTGVGIPHENLENLFKPFQTTKKTGLGLGLTYCKQTIDEHIGTLEVTSEVGEGTTFTITLPLGKAEENGTEEVWINPSPILQRQDTYSISPQ